MLCLWLSAHPQIVSSCCFPWLQTILSCSIKVRELFDTLLTLTELIVHIMSVCTYQRKKMLETRRIKKYSGECFACNAHPSKCTLMSVCFGAMHGQWLTNFSGLLRPLRLIKTAKLLALMNISISNFSAPYLEEKHVPLVTWMQLMNFQMSA